MKVRLFVDGASRGNPGPAGLGAVLQDARGQTLVELSESVGETTNNVAEYRALLRGLAEARALGADEVEVFADSDLLVRQVTGAYRVKSAHLLPLYREVRTLLETFRRWRISHVPREENAAADALANQAIDAAARNRVVELTALTIATAGGWRAWIPALPGCEVTAETETAALARLRRLAAAHLAKGARPGRPPLPREHRLRFPVEAVLGGTVAEGPGEGD